MSLNSTLTLWSILETERVAHTNRHYNLIMFSVHCNPMVDIVFLLDGHSSVTSSEFMKQKYFVRDMLEQHVAPTDAVKVI